MFCYYNLELAKPVLFLEKSLKMGLADYSVTVVAENKVLNLGRKFPQKEVLT